MHNGMPGKLQRSVEIGTRYITAISRNGGFPSSDTRTTKTSGSWFSPPAADQNRPGEREGAEALVEASGSTPSWATIREGP